MIRTRSSIPTLLVALTIALLWLMPSATWAQTFYQDAFAGAAGTNLTAHAPNVGGAYTQDAVLTAPILLDGSGHVYASSSSIVRATTVPISNPGDYTIAWDEVLNTSADGDVTGYLLRLSAGNLNNFNKATISQTSGVIQFGLGNQSNSIGTPVTLSPPSFPAIYHCTATVSGSDISATISGPGITGTQSISVPGGAQPASNTGYALFSGPSGATTHYSIANASGYQGSPISYTTTAISASNLALFGLSQEMWDVSSASSGYIDNLLPAGAIDMNVTIPTGGGAATINCSTAVTGTVYIAAVVDGTYLGRVAISGGTNTITTGTLTAGTHRLRFMNTGGGYYSRFSRGGDSAVWRVTGITLPVGSTINASSRPNGYALFIGDSITEGTFTDSTQPGSTQNTNVWYSWTRQLADNLGLVPDGLMIQGMSLLNTPAGAVHYEIGAMNAGVPDGSNDGWDHILSGVPRTFSPPPAFIMLCLGTNEYASDPLQPGNSGSYTTGEDANLTANLQVWIGRVRAKSALSATPIYVSIPFGGYKRSALIAGVAAYLAAHPSETHLFIFDLGWGSSNLLSSGPGGIDEIALMSGLTANYANQTTASTTQAADAVHPNAPTDAQIAAVVTALLTPGYTNVAPGSGALSAGTITLSGTGGSMIATGGRAIGGSAPYTYQFQTSPDGTTWTNAGSAIANQGGALSGVAYSTTGVAGGTRVRLKVTDSANTAVIAYSAVQTYGASTSLLISAPIDAAFPSGLTAIQQIEELYVLDQCKYHVSTLSPTTHQRTITYYAADGTTVLATAVQTYDATNTNKTARTPRLQVFWNNFATAFNAGGNLLLTTPIDATGTTPITVGAILRREDAVRAGTGTRTLVSSAGNVVDTASFFGQGGSSAAAVLVSTITTHADGSCDRAVVAN